MRPAMPVCVMMFVCAVEAMLIALLAVLDMGVNSWCAKPMESKVVDNRYSSLGIRTRLLMYMTWSMVTAFIERAEVMAKISSFAILYW